MAGIVVRVRDVPPQVTNWNIANAVTVLRVALVPVLIFALLQQNGQDTTWRIVAFAVFALAAISDHIDGHLARSRGLITDFGKLLDPIADKLLIGSALIVLSALGELPWWITVVILLREVGITVWRLTIAKTRVIAASSGGKLKTVLQIFAIGLYLLPLDGAAQWVLISREVIMFLAIILTVATGIQYLWAARASAQPAKIAEPRVETNTAGS